MAPRQAGGPAPCDSAPHGRAPPPPQEAWRAVLRCARPLCICCPNRPLRPVSSLDVGEGWHLPTLGSRWVAGD